MDIQGLQRRLEAVSQPAKREWWERYLKGVIRFRGVPMADIRAQVHAWVDESQADVDDLGVFALRLLEEPIAEDKLAGILIWQELLVPAARSWSADLEQLAALFDRGFIWDWNTTDWLCVRVLGPLAERHGRDCAEEIAGWVTAPGLWRRRAAGVSFVNLASQGDRFYSGFVDLLIDVCDENAADPERFSQTGVGWVLRELSDAEPKRVHRFLLDNRDRLSREALRMGAARLTDEQRGSLGLVGKRSRR